MAALLAVIVGLIVYLTLFPFEFHFAARHTSAVTHLLHSWPGRVDRGFVRDTALNIALYLPLGATACLAFAHHASRRTALLLAVLHGFTLSLAIELLQYYELTRYSSLADVAFNTVGALGGAALGLLYRRRIEAFTSGVERRGAPAGIVLAVCWLASQLYPLVPHVRSAQLAGGWAMLVASRLSWVEIVAGAAGWFVFGLALRAVWGKLPWAWLALATFAVPLRLLIWDRMVAWNDVAAAALGVLLWCAAGDAVRPGVGWVLMVAAVVLRELAPFDFGGPAHAFYWRPFTATMGAAHSSGVSTILRKAFEYGSLVWLLHAGKYRYLTAGVLVGIGLFAMEMMQTHMPGRVPESTDSLLALLMALVLHLVS